MIMNKNLIIEQVRKLNNYLDNYNDNDLENVIDLLKEVKDELNKDNISLLWLLQNNGWYINDNDYKNDLRTDLSSNPKAMIKSVIYTLENDILNQDSKN